MSTMTDQERNLSPLAPRGPEAMGFVQSDGGRARSRRPRQKDDCTVRALAVVTGRPYDEAYDALAAAGRRASRGFDFRRWAATACFAGFRLRWTPLPAVRGRPRTTPDSFVRDHPEGRFVLRTAKHVMACVDGAVHDTHQPRPGRCVYGYWTLDRAPGA